MIRNYIEAVKKAKDLAKSRGNGLSGPKKRPIGMIL